MANPTWGFATGLGYNPYLLKAISEVVGAENAPDLKIGNYGFLRMLEANNPISENRLTAPGAVDFIQVKAKQRLTRNSGYTMNTDTCQNSVTMPYQEQAVPLNIFRSISLYVDDALVQKYTDELNKVMNEGAPAGPFMGEMVEMIMSAAEALLGDLDNDLLTQLSVGYNPAESTSGTTSVNIPQTVTSLPLNSAINTILTDYQVNQNYGKPQIIGGAGNFLKFMNFQPFKSFNQAGENTALEPTAWDFYYDDIATTTYGINDIVVIAPGTVRLVEFNKFTGPYAGLKGTSWFGHIVLPIQMTGNKVANVGFDYQLRYLDCPSTTALTDTYYGTSLAVNRGYELILSKTCGLYQVPTNSYRATDPLNNSNGTVRYTITNT
jgi:hypothetical protein